MSAGKSIWAVATVLGLGVLLFGSTFMRLGLERGEEGEREERGEERQAEPAGPAGAAPLVVRSATAPLVMNFDGDHPGMPPARMKGARTGPGPAGDWAVVADAGAPSPPNVLAQRSKNRTSGRFPMSIATDREFRDVQVAVRFKPISGRVDQAGGLVFRYRDADNYYLVRANALENNCRLYHVKGGRRSQFADGAVHVAANQWHSLRVLCVGDRIQVHLDDRLLIDAKDGTFSEAGLVGVWTKADSYTHFDDLTAHEVAAEP